MIIGRENIDYGTKTTELQTRIKRLEDQLKVFWLIVVMFCFIVVGYLTHLRLVRAGVRCNGYLREQQARQLRMSTTTCAVPPAKVGLLEFDRSLSLSRFAAYVVNGWNLKIWSIEEAAC